MPRPKRSKVAPSIPAPSPKKAAKPAEQTPAVARPPKADFNDLYDVSDPEDRIVTSARRVQNTRSEAPTIGRQGPATSFTTRNAESREPEHDRGNVGMLENISSELAQDCSSPAVEVGRRESATPAIESSVLAIGKFKRRARQPSILGRGPGRARSSSVDSDLAEDNGLVSVGRKITGPRNESMMGRNPAPVLASSMALQMGTPAHVGSAMKIANFKRRARAPSILGTAQKPQAPRVDYDDDEDDFQPDDESTPLNLSKVRIMNSSSGASSSNSRKRKLSAVQVPQSSPIVPTERPIEAEETIPSTEQLRSDEEEESEQDEPLMPSIELRSHTSEIHSETMAPPRSSSSDPPSPPLPLTRRTPPRGRRQLRGRTPPPRTQDSPISSPPSLTHSPNRPPLNVAKLKLKKAAPPPSTFSTAQLQALLPRRRRRAAHDTFDIPSSDDEVDISDLRPEDDELSHLHVQARSRRHITLNRTPAPLKKPAKGKQLIKAKTAIVKRTYGSRAANPASDKENEADLDPDDSLGPLPDGDGHESPENSQDMEARVGKELKQAARKFQEVDKWELEFEEVTASSSSPGDAR